MSFPRVKDLLFGHVSESTAYVVNDYPYGFRLRCSMRYWIETDNKKGDRFCAQTTNPKVAGEVWNKPKKTTYKTIMFMYLDEKSHVQALGIRPWEEKDFPALMDFLISVSDNLSLSQMDSIRMWYFQNTSINHGFRLSHYNDDRKEKFTQWTKETLKHISGAAFEDLLKHRKAPLRDKTHRDGDFYIGLDNEIAQPVLDQDYLFFEGLKPEAIG